MNFAATDEQVMLRDMSRKFASELRENAHTWQDDGLVPDSILVALGELGLMGALAPLDSGGSGIDVEDLAVAVEEIASVDASLALLLALHNATLLLLGEADVVGDLCAGNLAALATSDALRAVNEAGTWALHGEAALIPGAKLASAFFVVATTDSGLALFQCEAQPELTPVTTHGLRAAGFADLNFDGVHAKPLLEGDALSDALSAMESARAVLLANVSVGLGRGSLNDALQYANEREQFGKPLAAFQAIQFKLADMATAVDAARLGTSLPAGLRYAREQAMFVCDEAVQIHGGYGYTEEYAVERRLRDARYFLTLGARG